MSADLLREIAVRTGGTVVSGRKCVSLVVAPEKVPDACAQVAAMPGFYHLSTITGVDIGEQIELLYHFWKEREFVVVRTRVKKENPRLSSIIAKVPSALFYEAEVKDLLGVFFEGNPFMKMHLLLPDEYPKDAPPPLRKEADPAKIRRMMKLE